LESANEVVRALSLAHPEGQAAEKLDGERIYRVIDNGAEARAG
jgi:hypothetical protein